jgi:hypothetical protein
MEDEVIWGLINRVEWKWWVWFCLLPIIFQTFDGVPDEEVREMHLVWNGLVREIFGGGRFKGAVLRMGVSRLFRGMLRETRQRWGR